MLILTAQKIFKYQNQLFKKQVTSIVLFPKNGKRLKQL